MIEYKFHKMDKEDLSLCSKMLREAAQRLKDKNIDQWAYWLNPPQDKIDWVAQGIYDGEFYKVLQDGQVVAMYRLQESDELYWGVQKEQARYIHSLVVSDKHTGKALGKTIIEKIEKETMENGVDLLRLDCNALNQGLCQYYEKLGFEKVGTVQMPYSLNALYEKKLTQ